MNKEIAIIIPAYEAHTTIGPLFNTIIAQTKNELCQVVLIGDEEKGAYDYLYGNFPQLDLTILYTNKPKSGPGVARNIGLEFVEKKKIPYIVFADADDIFYSNLAIEFLYAKITQEDGDLAFGWFYSIVDGAPVLYDDYDIWLFSKIYRTKIIEKNNIRFPETSANEDVCFNLYYWLLAEKKINIPLPLYVWQENPNSITRSKNYDYVTKSYPCLCDNLRATYKKIFENKTINKNNIKASIINRVIRLYYGYNGLYLIADEKVKQEAEFALSKLYDEIVSKFWSEITEEEISQAWRQINDSTGAIIPNIGFYDFTKKIRGEL